ncbi:MAG: HAD family hydrolase [Pseudonocardia sp.]
MSVKPGYSERRSNGSQLAGVLWDLDGTLIDSRALWETAYHEFAEQQEIRLPSRFWEQINGRTVEASVKLMFNHVGLIANRSAVERAGSWLTTRVGRLIEDKPALLRWRPGAKEVLYAVQGAGLPTALVTTTWRFVTDRILIALDARFDVTVCGDEVTQGKPAPDSYLRAAALLDICLVSCLAVEDSPAGVAAAEAAGIAVLAVPYTTPIGPSRGRSVRSSLTGLTTIDLKAIHCFHRDRTDVQRPRL